MAYMKKLLKVELDHEEAFKDTWETFRHEKKPYKKNDEFCLALPY